MKSTYIFPLLMLLCLMVQAQEPLQVIHITGGINTVGSETAPMLFDNHTLYYSQLPHTDASGRKMELDAALNQVMQASVDADGVPRNPVALRDGINSQKEHVGNTAYDSRNGVLYFSRCETAAEGSGPCALYSAKRKGDKWKDVKSLGKEINMEGFTSTQPTVAYLPDNQGVLLYFASNRPGGLGGMDLWYTVIDNGKASAPINLGQPINSVADEITPFYDSDKQVLYFSSDRPGGFGGYDIYASNGVRNSYCRPVQMPSPINSPQNDMYYVVADTSGNYGYLSSNRAESLYLVDSFCCNDLFMWSVQPVEMPLDTMPNPWDQPTPNGKGPNDSIEVVHEPTPSAHDPIVLYFHNDDPVPGTSDTTTKSRYDVSVQRYIAMLPQYKAAWATRYKGRTLDSVSQVLTHFFTSEVQGNYDRLEGFLWIIAEELWNGKNVTITIRGYASPLHNSDYNVRLSQRRIHCFLNYLNAWNSGNLRRCIASGQLRIEQAPFGSSTAAKNVSASLNDKIHSVYSVEAARERRVEIIDYALE
ncbi:MAG: PD40 domain-containing protein [Bacteroidales bacterium]|nr:PD40 domain-containing protein [Bacteroidales bacterium]